MPLLTIRRSKICTDHRQMEGSTVRRSLVNSNKVRLFRVPDSPQQIISSDSNMSLRWCSARCSLNYLFEIVLAVSDTRLVQGCLCSREEPIIQKISFVITTCATLVARSPISPNREQSVARMWLFQICPTCHNLHLNISTE